MSLAIGDKAPDFTLPTGDGTITLSQLKVPVVVYFYPKDDTPGCTTEACDFRDASPQWEKLGVRVIGISKDSLTSHDKFAKKYQLNFTLASDSDGAVCQAYGVWQEKSMYGKSFFGIERSTFLIDKNQIIRAVWAKVKVAGHVAAVQQAAEQLAAA